MDFSGAKTELPPIAAENFHRIAAEHSLDRLRGRLLGDGGAKDR